MRLRVRALHTESVDAAHLLQLLSIERQPHTPPLLVSFVDRPLLLQALPSQALALVDAFYRATVELGVADNVTTFTASDFGRTLSSNGDGSDHGWGAHHFLVGGGVRGGRFYGRAPQVSVTSNDQVGQGRLLPSTSVDELSSTLALWLGVSPSELPSVAPNIGRFASPDLGFMKAAQTALTAKR